MTIVNAKDFLLMAGVRDEIPNLNGLTGKNRDGVTDKQKVFLRNLGIGTTQIKYKGQASFVIDEAIRRRNFGLATPGQMRALKQIGENDVSRITFTQAVEKLKKWGYTHG